MHQRDYILRIIEQLGAALVELRKRILGGGSADTEVQLTEAAGQIGFDLALLRRFDLNTLRLLIAPSGEVDPTRCWVIAEVLYLDGLDASLTDREGRDSLLKARALYELVKPSGSTIVGLPEATGRIDEINRILDELEGHSTSQRPRRVSARRRSPALRDAG